MGSSTPRVLHRGAWPNSSLLLSCCTDSLWSGSCRKVFQKVPTTARVLGLPSFGTSGQVSAGYVRPVCARGSIVLCTVAKETLADPAATVVFWAAAWRALLLCCCVVKSRHKTKLVRARAGEGGQRHNPVVAGCGCSVLRLFPPRV